VSDLLREADAAYLNEKGFDWEAELEAGLICLVLKNFELPTGYVPGRVDLLLRLPIQFPLVAPDMFWTEPAVSYVGGVEPPASQMRETHLGRSWQRWSRHFGQSQWRSGIDDLRSYLRLIRATLDREVAKLAA
jgi:hypothetical protein